MVDSFGLDDSDGDGSFGKKLAEQFISGNSDENRTYSNDELKTLRQIERRKQQKLERELKN